VDDIDDNLAVYVPMVPMLRGWLITCEVSANFSSVAGGIDAVLEG